MYVVTRKNILQYKQCLKKIYISTFISKNRFKNRLTIFIKKEFVETKTAGLFSDKSVYVFGAVVVNRDGIF